MNLDKCPWPWFGGKSKAAGPVWDALGDVMHYVEPFAGSCAVLLNRPHPLNRHYHSETVNDADGLLVNAWRAIQMSPDLTADHASWPTSEADLMARHLALLAWRQEGQLERLMADPCFYDAPMAGWWINGLCQWIGSGWCAGDGPWQVGGDGRVAKRPRTSKTPPGVSRQLPHLGNDGQGVNKPALRDGTPGVSRQLPHLGNDGQGVNNAALRDGTPGVSRQLPHLGNDGRGVNKPTVRDGTPGHVVNGRSIWHPAAPDLTSADLITWFQHLAQRLRWVRIVNGDWRRVVTGGAINNLSIRQKATGMAGIFLDPPYADTAGRADLYAVDSQSIAHEVRAWALANGDNPRWRIVLACFDGEHDARAFKKAGWTVAEWFKPGHLQGGMANVGGTGNHQQARERMWLSPHCLRAETAVAPAAAACAARSEPPERLPDGRNVEL